MMKIRFFLSLCLLAALLAACAPDSAPTNPPATATQPPVVFAPTATIAAPILEPATEPAPGEEATALPVATSRGPDLHATDPTTVSLASGGLQFVEFFRFT
ncbi:MAG TPA: hypothetical protein VMN99_01825 [Anaerolineales bacterium]|nr:hypothetical protein [Anaerolineales bacterium]